jgi:rubrerythrin
MNAEGRIAHSERKRLRRGGADCSYTQGMDVDLTALPVPDWNLVCPRCRYPLQGLPAHRCPECGLALDMSKIVAPWTRVRGPRFSGHELPIPDFGLGCGGCGTPLLGWSTRQCPECGAMFDPEARRPAKAWFAVEPEMCGPMLTPMVEMLLAGEYVPHFYLDHKTFLDISLGGSARGARLMVHREFYYELLWLLREEAKRVERERASVGDEWRCGQCGADNPGNFDLCWSCLTRHD